MQKNAHEVDSVIVPALSFLIRQASRSFYPGTLHLILGRGMPMSMRRRIWLRRTWDVISAGDVRLSCPLPPRSRPLTQHMRSKHARLRDSTCRPAPSNPAHGHASMPWATASMRSTCLPLSATAIRAVFISISSSNPYHMRWSMSS